MKAHVEERQYPEGVDCVWIGSDRDGRLGVFVTGGEGPIPALALDAKRIPVEEIEGRLLGLPPTTLGRIIVALKRPDDFLELARRGLFAYDWSDVHHTQSENSGKYEQIAVPETPLMWATLPAEIASLLAGITFSLAFPQENLIDARKALQCREPT